MIPTTGAEGEIVGFGSVVGKRVGEGGSDVKMVKELVYSVIGELCPVGTSKSTATAEGTPPPQGTGTRFLVPVGDDETLAMAATWQLGTVVICVPRGVGVHTGVSVGAAVSVSVSGSGLACRGRCHTHSIQQN